MMRTHKPIPRKQQEIPSKRYFAIGEVSRLCALEPHVLRYWEKEFPQISPSKRCGNRRYYQREDVVIIRKIRALLYEQGYTIQGARNLLEQEKITASGFLPTPSGSYVLRDVLKETVDELQSVLEYLE